MRSITAWVGLSWLLVSGACGGNVSLDARPCPCATGYVCCAATATCVPSGAVASCVGNQGAPSSSGSLAGADSVSMPMEGGAAALGPSVGGSAGTLSVSEPLVTAEGGAGSAASDGGASGDNADAGMAGQGDGRLHDSWLPMSAGPLAARDSQIMVWAGDDAGNGALVVWGGIDNQRDPGQGIADGARYYPRGDRWATISTDNAPSGRFDASAVWTGSRVLIWGGSINDDDPGASYDPLSDSWQPIAPCPFKVLGYGAFSTWTGSRMLVFNSQVARGASYDPESDVWSALSTDGAPNTLYGSAVWTGKSWILWGGQAQPGPGLHELNTGAIYDPAQDRWAPMNTLDAPIGRQSHSAVWTGTRMLIWGGLAQIAPGSDTTYQVADGALYDPDTNTWQALSVPSALAVPTLDASALRAGSGLLFWGGFAGDSLAQHGARADLSAANWSPLAVLQQPALRIYQTAVWTGAEMLVWGGAAPPVELASGARYFP